MPKICQLFFFTLLLSVVIGCASDQGPKLVPVSGKVTLTTGAAVQQGYINFVPDISKGNKCGTTGIGFIKNGEYTMKTGEKTGIEMGWYKVTISASKDVNPNNPYVTEWLADVKYNDPTRSKIFFEVVENPAEGRYDIKLLPHTTKARK